MRSRINNTKRKIGNFFKSESFKELSIFSIFIVISLVFWMAQKLKEQMEYVVEIPIHYTNVPDNIVFSSSAPTTFQVRVQDQGFAILGYFSKQFQPIEIDLRQHSTKSGVVAFSYKQYDTDIRSRFQPGTRILLVSPEVLQLSLLQEKQKRLAVILNGNIDTENQFCINGDIVIYPNVVTAYGAQEVLDSLSHINTAYFEETTLRDSVSLTVGLEQVNGARFVPSVVDVDIPVEAFTETSIDLPIKITNLPSNLKMITFPSNVRVTYCVPLSYFSSIKPENFDITLDYNEFKTRADQNSRLVINKIPAKIFNVRISPEEVECVVEEKQENLSDYNIP